MNRLTTLFLFIAIFLACTAKEIIIIPQFEQGEILKYRTMSQFRTYEGKDTTISTTKLLPEIIVEQLNDKGLILRTSSRHETSTYQEHNLHQNGLLYNPRGDLNDLVATRTLLIQLNRDFRPDSVLNLDYIRKEMPNDYIRWITDDYEDINETSAEQKTTIDPLDEAYLDSICVPRHLIEQHFSNLPYFSFYGIPLESGKIPASLVLTEDLMGMCSGINELDIEIRRYEKGRRSAKDNETLMIKIHGQNGESEIEGSLLFKRGIMNKGLLKTRSGSEDKVIFVGVYTIEQL